MLVLISVASAHGQPGQGDRPPPPPDPKRFVEHAMSFDGDGDGKLSREELQSFAEDFARGPMGRGPERPRGERDSTTLAHNVVKITEKDGFRFFESNGMPDHKHGEFPNRGNPNTISVQRYQFRVPLKPKMADKPIDAGGVLFGIALNGIPFDPGTAELWRNDPEWRYDALSGKINLGLDESNAHVQPNGAYHYHGLPLALILKLGKADQITLVGYAADGFPIYNQVGHADAKDAQSPLAKLRSSYQLKKGQRPDGDEGPGGEYDGTFNQDFEYVAGSGDLDECNGRFSATPEFSDGIYHYVITEQFPFISRRFKGTPDDSFRRRGPRGRGPDFLAPPNRDEISPKQK